VKSRDADYARYVTLDSVLNPVSKPTPFLLINELLSLFTIIQAIFKYSTLGIKRAMVSGNYHKPRGLGFGGDDYATSTRNLLTLLTQTIDIPNLAKSLILIDVHTGLGPRGVDTLMFSASDSQQVEAVFPSEHQPHGQQVIGGIKLLEKPPKDLNNKIDVLEEFDLTLGTIGNALCSNFLVLSDRAVEYMCMTEEFGTVPSIQIGKFFVEENYAHFYGSPSEKAYYGEQLKHCYHVNTKEWKRQIVHRGLMVFVQVPLLYKMIIFFISAYIYAKFVTGA
jgi:hypothetical protein